MQEGPASPASISSHELSDIFIRRAPLSLRGSYCSFGWRDGTREGSFLCLGWEVLIAILFVGTCVWIRL